MYEENEEIALYGVVSDHGFWCGVPGPVLAAGSRWLSHVESDRERCSDPSWHDSPWRAARPDCTLRDCALPWCKRGVTEGEYRFCWCHRCTDEHGAETTWPHYEARVDRNARIRAGLPRRDWYVYVSHTERCYGGPEEGGWWYDCETLTEVVVVKTMKEALGAIRRLREEYPPPRYGRGSVLGGADVTIRQVYTADDLPPREPPPRPRYE